MSDKLTLTLTADPDTWSGKALRDDFYRIAETVRAANHATLDRPGVLADIDDATSVVGSLISTTERMWQLLGQIGPEIRRAQEAGYIGCDRLDPEQATLQARDILDDASQAAAALSEQLKGAWKLLDQCQRTDRFWAEHPDADGIEDQDQEAGR